MIKNAIFTSWILPKRFIDATSDYDPYLQAIEESKKETKQ